MAEYIDREALIKDIGDSVRFSSRNGVSAEMRGATKIVDRIFSAPTVDVVEVVHGKWLQTKYEGVFECSECYEEWYVTGIARAHPLDNNAFYCPCCGAKMDGEGGQYDIRNN